MAVVLVELYLVELYLVVETKKIIKDSKLVFSVVLSILSTSQDKCVITLQ